MAKRIAQQVFTVTTRGHSPTGRALSPSGRGLSPTGRGLSPTGRIQSPFALRRRSLPLDLDGTTFITSHKLKVSRSQLASSCSQTSLLEGAIYKPCILPTRGICINVRPIKKGVKLKSPAEKKTVHASFQPQTAKVRRVEENKSLAVRPSNHIETLKPPAQKEAVQLPAQKEAVKPPAQKEAVKPPAQKEAVKPPAQKEAVKPSAQKEAVKPSAQKEAVKPSAQKEAVKPSAQKEAVKPSAQKEAVKPSAQKEAVKPSAQREAVKPSAHKEAQRKVPQKETSTPLTQNGTPRPEKLNSHFPKRPNRLLHSDVMSKRKSAVRPPTIPWTPKPVHTLGGAKMCLQCGGMFCCMCTGRWTYEKLDRTNHSLRAPLVWLNNRVSMLSL